MIPNKSVFKFQELTPITGVKPYVIRFWETEFEDIIPVTSDTGEKLYGRRDVEILLKIKKLLFDDKLSIPEAKLALRNLDAVSAVADDWKAAIFANEEMVSDSDRSELKNALTHAMNLIKEIKQSHHW